MTIRKITITDHSWEQGDLPARKVLEIEIQGDPRLAYIDSVTKVICDEFKNRVDHSIMVEDLKTTRNEVYTKEAWREAS